VGTRYASVGTRYASVGTRYDPVSVCLSSAGVLS